MTIETPADNRRITTRRHLDGLTLDWIPRNGAKVLRHKSETVRVTDLSASGLAVERRGTRHREKLGTMVVIAKSGHEGVVSVRRIEVDKATKTTIYGLQYVKMSDALAAGLQRIALGDRSKYDWHWNSKQR